MNVEKTKQHRNIINVVAIFLETRLTQSFSSIFQIKHHQKQHFAVLNFCRTISVRRGLNLLLAHKMQSRYIFERDNRMDYFFTQVSHLTIIFCRTDTRISMDLLYFPFTSWAPTQLLNKNILRRIRRTKYQL